MIHESYPFFFFFFPFIPSCIYIENIYHIYYCYCYFFFFFFFFFWRKYNIHRSDRQGVRIQVAIVDTKTW